jgi:hypothetical protein
VEANISHPQQSSDRSMLRETLSRAEGSIRSDGESAALRSCAQWSLEERTRAVPGRPQTLAGSASTFAAREQSAVSFSYSPAPYSCGAQAHSAPADAPHTPSI